MQMLFKKEYVGAACILLLLLIVAFYDVVFLGKTFKVTTANSQALPTGVYGQAHNKPKFIPVNGTDAPVLEEPIYRFIKKNLKRGVFPLWNPHQACGYPLVGMIQVAIFYPLNLILYVLPEKYAWDIFILFRLFLAGFLTYWFMRTIGFSKIPALASGVTFMLSGPMVLLQYWTANVDILLPLLLLGIEHVIRKTKIKSIVYLSLAVMLTILGGHPEHIFLVNAYGVAFFLFRSYFLRKEIDRKKSFVYLISSYLLGICLSAIVLFPFIYNLLFEFWHGHPERVGLLMEENRFRALSLALPHFFQEVPLSYEWVFSGWWGGYLGTLPLGLAFLSLFYKDKHKLNFLFIFLAFFVIAKQYSLPVINWIGYLPLFDMCRYAIHAPALAAFSIAVLAGVGIKTVLETPNVFRKGLFYTAAILLIADIYLILLHPKNIFNIPEDIIQNTPIHIPMKATLFAFCILIVFQAILFLKDKKLLNNKLISILLLGALFVELFFYIHRERPHRFRSFAKVPYIELLKTSPEKIRSYGNFWAFYPNTATGFGLDDLGYFFGLVPKRFVHFTNSLLLKDYFKKNLNPPALRAIPIQAREHILDMLNVKFIIMPHNSEQYLQRFAHFKDAIDQLKVVYKNEVTVYERPNVFPRLFIVHRAIFQPNKEQSLLLVNQLGDQLRRVAVINHPPIPKIISYLKSVPAVDKSTAQIVEYTPNEIVIDAAMEHGGFLVLSEAYHPDWKVTLDGNSWKVFQTNYLIRSVFVPPGKHQIQFTFRPPSFYWGIGLSSLAFVALLFLLYLSRLRQEE